MVQSTGLRVWGCGAGLWPKFRVLILGLCAPGVGGHDLWLRAHD